MSVYRHRGVSPSSPEPFRNHGLAITDGFTAFFQLQNSKLEAERRGGGRERIDSGAPYQTDPLALTYRFDSSRHCLERSLVNSISSGWRKSGFSRDYAAAVISNF